MLERYRCILLFGAPGVGKGTQGVRLGGHEGFVHLATGNIFRSLDRTSPTGKKFIEYSSRGDLVPDELTVEMFHDHVEGLIARCEYDPHRQVLLLDGIPRSVRQAEILEAHIDPIAIIHLNTHDRDQMVARMKRRAEKEGRHDDTDESVIRRRFEVYEEHTSPVLGHYDPSLVIDIDALGSMDEVTQRIEDAVMPVFHERFQSAAE